MHRGCTLTPIVVSAMVRLSPLNALKPGCGEPCRDTCPPGCAAELFLKVDLRLPEPSPTGRSHKTLNADLTGEPRPEPGAAGTPEFTGIDNAA